MQELKYIIESLLFVAEEPLPVAKLRGILETFDGKEIRTALEVLAEEYDQRGGGFLLREVAGGWQMRSRPEYHEWIKRMLQPSPQRLSRAALETLAVIAYKQPIIRADIEHIRGVDCGGVLRQLMERKLVRVLGRKEIAGRPLIYATTKLFLEMFDLKDLNDLPTPKEIADFGNTADDTEQDVVTEESEASPAENSVTGSDEDAISSDDNDGMETAEGGDLPDSRPETDSEEMAVEEPEDGESQRNVPIEEAVSVLQPLERDESDDLPVDSSVPNPAEDETEHEISDESQWDDTENRQADDEPDISSDPVATVDAPIDETEEEVALSEPDQEGEEDNDDQKTLDL